MCFTCKNKAKKIISALLVIAFSFITSFTAKSEGVNLRQSQDVSGVLNATMQQLAETVKEPSFGTNAGEWTVFSLARGGYFSKNNAYFINYYNRIVETVNETASKVNLNGALDKNKSTENSRLIVALSAIGKDATSVGNWNLVEAYSANGINWIKKQGLNGTIWTLIALDSNNYVTTDETIRQKCVDSILSARHNDGGWSLITAKAQPSNVDITCMALTALYPYRNQPEVATACAEAIEWLSNSQLSTGGFPYGASETSESCVWAIVALTTWEINPDTDTRFIKDGKSAVDNLLSYYIATERMFAHQGKVSNAMATDQACYALVAYNRFINGKTALYDYSDVNSEKDETVIANPKATLWLPARITDDISKTFNANIYLDMWDNTAGYKLIDFVVNVPKGLSVAEVTVGKRIGGGTVNYNFEADTGKLRVVYFDANNNNDITLTNNEWGNAFPALFFTVTFKVEEVNVGDELGVSLGGMSIKLNSDSTDENAMVVVDTATAGGNVKVIEGISYTAVCLYMGDDVDLIPSTKKAVAVSVTGISGVLNLTYNDGINRYEFKHSEKISQKNGIETYVALVDATITVSQFTELTNFSFTEENAREIIFGDATEDGVINAQDALAAVDTWLRKTDAPTDDEILALNVNSDSRINTFDALGIVEAFVNDNEFLIVTKTSTIDINN